MDVQPLAGEPALHAVAQNTLLIADLHIGIEQELREAGLSVPSQSRAMERRLHSLITKHDIKTVYILGDVKHNIPLTPASERTDVKFFMKRLAEKVAVHVVPGNHDGNIEWYLPTAVQMHPSSGVCFEGCGLLHGHSWPSPQLSAVTTLILAHTHPTVQFMDRLGYRSVEPCWLRGSFDSKKVEERYPQAAWVQYIVLPTFNPLCGGVAVNKDPLLGPVASLFDVEHMEAYLLDGTALGKPLHL
jgi:uncharacterized protein